jgi:hypothetical protein
MFIILYHINFPVAYLAAVLVVAILGRMLKSSSGFGVFE